MFKKKEKSTTLTPKSNKQNTTIWVAIAVISVLLLLIFIIGGSIMFNNYQTNKAKEESYKSLVESLNITFATDERLLTIEAAPAVTFSSTDALKNVPDQIRGLFASYTGDSEITTSALDISTVGDKQVTVTITKSDRFGQVATKQERIIVTVVDTQEPQVDLVAAIARADNEAEVKANILRVADPVFGYYQYSSSLENHTYRLDLSQILVDNRTNKYIEGCYPITVEMNDSGNIVKRYFDITVGGDDFCKLPEEEIVVEEEQTEIIVEGQGEETPADATSGGQ